MPQDLFPDLILRTNKKSTPATTGMLLYAIYLFRTPSAPKNPEPIPAISAILSIRRSQKHSHPLVLSLKVQIHPISHVLTLLRRSCSAFKTAISILHLNKACQGIFIKGDKNSSVYHLYFSREENCPHFMQCYGSRTKMVCALASPCSGVSMRYSPSGTLSCFAKSQ